MVGPGLVFQATFRDDGSWIDLFFLQYEPPALVPVLEAFLVPGATFVDVGANIGVYAGWAAKLVGSRGRVVAFEPVPSTRSILQRTVADNQLAQVEIVPRAVGSAPGVLTLYMVPQASGLASAVPPASAGAARVEVPVTTLDVYARETGMPAPSLVKIDVEGYEFEVLRGARALLSAREHPAVIFETQAGHLQRAGVLFSDLQVWFAELGYRLFALLPRGLQEVPPGTPSPPSTNALALDPQRHADALERLRPHRFRRNQSC